MNSVKAPSSVEQFAYVQSHCPRCERIPAHVAQLVAAGGTSRVNTHVTDIFNSRHLTTIAPMWKEHRDEHKTQIPAFQLGYAAPEAGDLQAQRNKGLNPQCSRSM